MADQDQQTPVPTTPNSTSQHRERVIQPSDDFVKELQSAGPSEIASPNDQSHPTTTPNLYNHANSTYTNDQILPGTLANSQNLNNKNSNKRSKSHLVRQSSIIIIILLLVGATYLLLNKLSNKASSLTPYTVSQSSPVYSVKFYPLAVVSQKNGLTYLIAKNSQDQQTAIWIEGLARPLSYGSNPTFKFTMQGQSRTGSDNNTNLYVADVQVNDQYYQINLNSQGIISLNDAKSIFSSVVIN